MRGVGSTCWQRTLSERSFTATAAAGRRKSAWPCLPVPDLYVWSPNVLEREEQRRPLLQPWYAQAVEAVLREASRAAAEGEGVVVARPRGEKRGRGEELQGLTVLRGSGGCRGRGAERRLGNAWGTFAWERI